MVKQMHAGIPGCYFYASNGLGKRTGRGRKEIKMRKKSLYPMNLHFFGYEGDGTGTGEGEGSGTGERGKEGTGEGGTGGDGTGKEQDNPEPKTFDEILKDSNYQAEFDRRVQKALGTAKAYD